LRKSAKEENNNVFLKRGKGVSGCLRARAGASWATVTFYLRVFSPTHVVAAKATGGWKTGISSGKGTKVRFQKKGRGVFKGWFQGRD
jgi:hypothetical protein